MIHTMETAKENTEQHGTDVGTAVKATQNGDLPVGTVEQILEAAPNDLITETLPIPEWGFSVVVRSLTGAQKARIRQIGVTLKGDRTLMEWGEMEIQQFIEGVQQPSMKKDQVRQLYSTSGSGFQKIITWLDEHSSMDKEAIAQAREEFQQSAE